MARSASAKKPAKKVAKKASSSSAKKASKPAAKPKAKKKVADEEVTIDRRRGDRRDDETAEAPEAQPAPAKLERREKVNRRRQIDPTTCERDYSDAEVEFMNALDEYKRKNGRMFPTCSEVLEVVRDLGYVQLTAAEKSARDAITEQANPEAGEDFQAESVAVEALELSDEIRVEDSEADA